MTDLLVQLADDLIAEMTLDYVVLIQPVQEVMRVFQTKDPAEVKRLTFVVLRLMLERGAWPGDYDSARLRFWKDESPDALLARLERSWDLEKIIHNAPGAPNVWFGLRPQG